MPHPAPHAPASSSSLRAFHAQGLVFFSTICRLVTTIFNALVGYYKAHPEYDSIRAVTLAAECLTALLALEYTLRCAPERITPRQIVRLAKAARALTRLTGQAFDFSLWTGLAPEELDRLSPKPTPNPLTEYRLRPDELRLPSAGERPIALLQHPGATLANVIRKILRILPPGFTPTAMTDLSPSPAPHVLSPSPSPSQSQSQSDLELASQSQSRSHSQSIPATPSTPSIPSTPTLDGGPLTSDIPYSSSSP